MKIALTIALSHDVKLLILDEKNLQVCNFGKRRNGTIRRFCCSGGRINIIATS